MGKYAAIAALAILVGVAVFQGSGDAQAGRQADRREVVMRLRAYWMDDLLHIDFRLRNTSEKTFEFGFRNSGRVCGEIRVPEGETVYEFPQITAQVMGSETLEPNQELEFRHAVQPEELAGLDSGLYTVVARLCGYKKLRAATEVRIPFQD